MFFLIFLMLVEIFYENRKRKQMLSESNSPLILTKATVQKKYRSIDRDEDGNAKSTALRFFVTFVNEDGEQIVLKLPYYKYILIREGTLGELIYKDHIFIDFTTY